MNNAKQKIRWIRVLRPVALALALVFLLSCATYAWLKRDWKPKIHQENVKIVAGSSLTFIYGEDEIDDISVNELLGEKNFVFKSISNSTGKSEDFFALDYSSQGPYYDTFKKISLLELDEDRLADGHFRFGDGAVHSQNCDTGGRCLPEGFAEGRVGTVIGVKILNIGHLDDKKDKGIVALLHCPN